MTNQTTTNQLLEVAQRIREMRQIIGFTTKQMAEKTEVPEEEYLSYEAGTADLPFTFMHKCALTFGVELTDLLEGHSAKLSSYMVTRRGRGPVTASEDGITIQNMAALFRQKLATPYWVTYQYSEQLQHEPIHTTTHAGQEFDLVIKGAMRVRVGDHEEVLHEGDSIFYKSSTPHGMIAVDGQDCVFLAMIMAGSETEQAMVVAPHKLPEPEAAPAASEEELPLLCEKFIRTTEDEKGSLRGIEFMRENEFNFAFDIVDGIARRDPEKLAMVHVANDMTERRFTFKDMKDASSQAANYFTSLGIKRGDRVMLVLKRHYQFWFAILGLHKLGAIAIPATNQLQAKDFSYRFNAADVRAILCTADGEGNMVSYMQSNYMGFGSGIVVRGTGVSLQNRGCDFSLDYNDANCLKPGKRSYHTIIPGFLLKDGKAVGPFGVMGGYMQPQGHVQVAMNYIDFHMNPQMALDAPRWQWMKDKQFSVEASFPNAIVGQLTRRGHEISVSADWSSFGRGQMIVRLDNGVLVGGCESRTDSNIACY